MDRQVSLKELLFSETATRLGIDNTPTDEVLVNLQNVCQFILEPVRNYFNKPITITSGYRSPELCKAIGSSATSQHTKGEAVDFEILGIANKEVSDWIVNHLDYDQCILEFWKPEEPNSGWVHCSYKPSGNRKQYLRAYKGNGRTIYEVL
jgi:hypothetical protein